VCSRARIHIVLLLGFFACGVSAWALDDPTRPPGYALPSAAGTAKTSPWRVNEIVIAKGRRHAVINGRRVRVGDRIRGARLVAIQPDAVHLQSPSRRWVLPLLNGTVHKRPRVERQ